MTLREAFAKQPNLLDALRLFFALFVLLAHCWPLAYGAEVPGVVQPSYEIVLRATNRQLFGGTLAVLFFFLLSGFLVTESYTRCSGLVDYLRRRALRIYPGYVVAMLLTAFGFAWAFATRPGEWLLEFPWTKYVPRLVGLHMCVTPEAFASNPYPLQPNGSLWTIAHEFWCYILVATLGLLGLLRSQLLLWGLFGAAWGVWNWQMLVDPLIVPQMRLFVFGKADAWPMLLTFFLAGVLAHRYADRIRLHGGIFLACVLALVVTARTSGLTLVVPFATTYAIFWIAFADVPFLRALTKRGDLSYGVYLYAWPVQQSLLAAWPTTFVGSPWVLALAATPLVLGIAVLSWHFVEAPFLRRKRRPTV